VADLPDLCGPGDLLVANDSLVVPARLIARKESGGKADLLVLPRTGPSFVHALVRSAKPLRQGQRLVLDDGTELLVVDAEAGRCMLDFGANGATAVLERIGRVPLPPYIRRGEEAPGDRERYQTVYARQPGSVAAPTAGLHITHEMLERLAEQGASFRTLTLHVGPGTFAPVRRDQGRHVMEAESLAVGDGLARAVEATRVGRGRVVAVGTTTVRGLETAADPERPGCLRAFAGETDLFIRPGFQFRVCDVLLTNFHLPRSPLLCLVMAFAGEDLLRDAYEQAVHARYRFYSYGDAMLIV
jgi:S-adenosylmethionine:tRNA ribosyltransferase-isomerase